MDKIFKFFVNLVVHKNTRINPAGHPNSPSGGPVKIPRYTANQRLRQAL